MAKGSEVLRSLVSGFLVYALTMACSSSGDDGSSVGTQDTGGVTGMNGNGGGNMGTGAVAMAATGGDQGAGGESSGTCDCPAPDPDQFFDRDCIQTANNSLWATLSVPGVTIDELMVVTARFYDSDGDPVTGFAGTKSAMATAVAFNDGEIKAQCVGVARFRVPASLASKVAP